MPAPESTLNAIAAGALALVFITCIVWILVIWKRCHGNVTLIGLKHGRRGRPVRLSGALCLFLAALLGDLTYLFGKYISETARCYMIVLAVSILVFGGLIDAVADHFEKKKSARNT